MGHPVQVLRGQERHHEGTVNIFLDGRAKSCPGECHSLSAGFCTLQRRNTSKKRLPGAKNPAFSSKSSAFHSQSRHNRAHSTGHQRSPPLHFRQKTSRPPENNALPFAGYFAPFVIMELSKPEKRITSAEIGPCDGPEIGIWKRIAPRKGPLWIRNHGNPWQSIRIPSQIATEEYRQNSIKNRNEEMYLFCFLKSASKSPIFRCLRRPPSRESLIT